MKSWGIHITLWTSSTIRSFKVESTAPEPTTFSFTRELSTVLQPQCQYFPNRVTSGGMRVFGYIVGLQRRGAHGARTSHCGMVVSEIEI